MFHLLALLILLLLYFGILFLCEVLGGFSQIEWED